MDIERDIMLIYITCLHCRNNFDFFPDIFTFLPIKVTKGNRTMQNTLTQPERQERHITEKLTLWYFFAFQKRKKRQWGRIPKPYIVIHEYGWNKVKQGLSHQSSFSFTVSAESLLATENIKDQKLLNDEVFSQHDPNPKYTK